MRLNDGLVAPRSIEWADIERCLALGEQGSMQQRYRDPLITDLARDMGWMQCFQKAKRNMGTKTDRNQHTIGTLGESETGEAYDWRLTDSQPTRSIPIARIAG